ARSGPRRRAREGRWRRRTGGDGGRSGGTCARNLASGNTDLPPSCKRGGFVGGRGRLLALPVWPLHERGRREVTSARKNAGRLTRSGRHGMPRGRRLRRRRGRGEGLDDGLV